MSFYRGTPVDDFDPRCPWKSLRSKLEPIIEPVHRDPEPAPDQQERERRRWVTSCHEAAHTGAFFWIGDAVRHVAIGDRVRGREYPGICTTKRGTSSDADQILALMAGEASEKLFFQIDHGAFEHPWARNDNGQLPRMSTDRCDSFLAGRRIADDDDKILQLVEDGWQRACEFVKRHEDSIRLLAARLNERGELSGVEAEVYWNQIFPHVRNPVAPTARTAPPAPVQHVVVYAVGREPVYRRVDGRI
jgi:hypothetical protein